MLVLRDEISAISTNFVFLFQTRIIINGYEPHKLILFSKQLRNIHQIPLAFWGNKKEQFSQFMIINKI